MKNGSVTWKLDIYLSTWTIKRYINHFITILLTWKYSENDFWQVTVEWDKEEPTTLKTSLAQGGRGMELSELVVFNGALLAFDDRTGTIYNIDLVKKFAYPWVLLVDGHGKVAKGT